MMTPDNAKRLGVRQPSGALTRRLVALKPCESGSIAKSEVLVASEQRAIGGSTQYSEWSATVSIMAT
jgi:hypothetical protein